MARAANRAFSVRMIGSGGRESERGPEAQDVQEESRRPLFKPTARFGAPRRQPAEAYDL
jgi:hypothetical protein